RIFARQGRFSAMLMHEFGQLNHREGGCPNKSRGSLKSFMRAANCISIVKRTLFEMNSRACRSETANLTSAQMCC
ncbi:hypothetical protein, partial [Escherichia coli]|uniref:hypothetical protein n=1 Tax=Escherichia coli TaxID=562 RepID=UPI003CF94150